MGSRTFLSVLFMVFLLMGAQTGVGIAEKGENADSTKIKNSVTEIPAAEEAKTKEAAPEKENMEAPDAEEAQGEKPAAEEAKAKEAAPEKGNVEAPAAEEAKDEKPAAEKQSKKKAAGKEELREALKTVSGDCGTLSASINGLYDQRNAKKGDEGKLNTLFADFQGRMKTVQADVENLNATYTEMKANLEAAFGDWEATLKKMENEKIRKSGEKRRERNLKTFETVKQDMQNIEKNLSSLVGQLKDVERYLTFDLTPDGVSEISGSFRDATKMSDGLQKDINKLLEKIGDLPNVSSMQAGT